MSIPPQLAIYVGSLSIVSGTNSAQVMVTLPAAWRKRNGPERQYGVTGTSVLDNRQIDACILACTLLVMSFVSNKGGMAGEATTYSPCAGPTACAVPARCMPLIYLIAGEASGDAIGARLMRAIAPAPTGRDVRRHWRRGDDGTGFLSVCSR